MNNKLLDTYFCEIVDITTNKVILSGELKSISLDEDKEKDDN